MPFFEEARRSGAAPQALARAQFAPSCARGGEHDARAVQGRGHEHHCNANCELRALQCKREYVRIRKRRTSRRNAEVVSVVERADAWHAAMQTRMGAGPKTKSSSL